ncbi:Vitamin B12 ABC transporter%2C permease component BtuC [Vibrio cholerae]|nr:Vitamin B12 ABC transporter%2C permease component BtuC [Vibrio cholerae]
MNDKMDFHRLLQHKQQRWQRSSYLLIGLFLSVCVLYLLVGELWLSPFSAWSSLEQQLVWELRLPRLLAAAVIGASLAVAGATLQVLLGNVLAEPGVVGVSGGASVAMVILLLFFPSLNSPVAKLRLTTARLLLVGVALGILSGAVVTWAFYFSDDLGLRQLMYWLMGSVAGVSWYQHLLSLVAVPVVIWLVLQGGVLDKLMLGEGHAKQLGIDIHRVRWRLILAIALLVGASVALGGVIGFVGLVVPHLLRLTLGSENRLLLPLSALCGALLLVSADLIARLALGSGELPLGVVTTTLGAPIFIWMLVRNHDSC